MFRLLAILRDDPEISLVLINLHTQDVEYSEVNLVDVESVMLVFTMLPTLEHLYIITIYIFNINAKSIYISRTKL